MRPSGSIPPVFPMLPALPAKVTVVCPESFAAVKICTLVIGPFVEDSGKVETDLIFERPRKSITRCALSKLEAACSLGLLEFTDLWKALLALRNRPSITNVLPKLN